MGAIMKRLDFRIKLSLVVLTLGIFLGACDDPKGRSAIRLGAIGFKDNATVAIDSVRVIYQLKRPQTDDAKQRVIVELLLAPQYNPNLDTAIDPIGEVDKLIKDKLTPKPINKEVNRALDELQSEYGAVADMFDRLENVRTFGELFGGGREAIDEAIKPARRLTLKMLILAHLISQNPPQPSSSERVVLLSYLSELQEQYKDPNLSESSKKEIEAKVGKIIDTWISSNKQDQVLLCDAYSKLLIAADTGVQLSNLLEEYNNLNIDQILATIERIFTVASNWTGGNYSQIITKTQAIKSAIDNNPSLKADFDALIKGKFSESQIYTPTSNTLNCSSQEK
jgi:hypothetical protein